MRLDGHGGSLNVTLDPRAQVSTPEQLVMGAVLFTAMEAGLSLYEFAQLKNAIVSGKAIPEKLEGKAKAFLAAAEPAYAQIAANFGNSPVLEEAKRHLATLRTLLESA
jgi:hypothetical protein